MKLAYVVSRFPTTTETFVLRELNAVSEHEDVEAKLLSLFPPDKPFVHPAARPWLASRHRPSVGESLRGLGWWALRRPLRLGSSILHMAGGCIRSPGVLLRSLLTIPVAAAHARTVRRDGVEHLHAHFATYPTLTAWLCHRLIGISYSFTPHAWDLFVDQSFLAEKVRDASFVVAISEYNRRFLARYGGDRETPVYLVHCGVNPGAYPFRPREVPRTGPVRALCVAALQEKKGHAVLFDALASGREELQRLRLDLVGGGELRDELGKRVAALGLADTVTFSGRLPEEEVRARLEATDLLILPSIVARDGQMEGLPIALIEAVACGVPVVTTRLSGIPELITDGETGVLAEPGDAGSLRAALERVLSGEVRLDLERGRRVVESEFDISGSGDRMVELFRDSLSAAKS